MAKGDSVFSQEAYENVGEVLSGYMTNDGGIFRSPTGDGELFYCLDYLDAFCTRIGYSGGTYPATIRSFLEKDFQELNEKIDSILVALDQAAEKIGLATIQSTKDMNRAKTKKSSGNTGTTTNNGGYATSGVGTSGAGVASRVATNGTSSVTASDNNNQKIKDTNSDTSKDKGVNSVAAKNLATLSLASTNQVANHIKDVYTKTTNQTSNNTSNNQPQPQPETKEQEPIYVPTDNNVNDTTDTVVDNNASAGGSVGVVESRTSSSGGGVGNSNGGYFTNDDAKTSSSDSSSLPGASVVEGAKDVLNKRGDKKSTVIPKSTSSSSYSSSSSSKGFNPVPLAIGLGAAVAGGIGIKAYKDHKENSEFDDVNDDSLTNGNRFWTDEDPNVINSEQNDMSGDDLFLDNNNPQNVKYEALENENTNNDTWSIDESLDTHLENNDDSFDLLGNN